MTKDIMDVKEIAAYLGFSPTKIYRLLTAAEIPHVKVGGQYRFPKAVIDDWLAGKLEVPKSTRGTKSVRKDQEQKTKPKPLRAEDEIVGRLLAGQSGGDASDRKGAKDIMREHAADMDWGYLAGQAQTAGVLESAIAIEKELLKEAKR